MTRTVILSVDQLYRRQPGGIATYVRGLAGGLAQVDGDLDLVGLAPRAAAPPDARDLPLRLVEAPVPLRLLTELWPRWPLGVPRQSNVVHATSMAGPFGGGATGAVHSVALHDLLWRDEPDASTPAGRRFHERRLALLARRDDLRILTSSPGLRDRLIGEGFEPTRIHPVRLGVDDASEPAEPAAVAALLGPRGVTGPYTLYVGTREPRKNLARLVAAHAMARRDEPALGPLVLAGPAGWGGEETGDAVVLGPLERSLLLGLYRDATVMAYVALAEGWGLPPVEALRAGTRVVASSTTPSVAGNDEVVVVDPLDVAAIAQGLIRAVAQSEDAAGRERRRSSVADLTWANSALDHLAGWR